MSTTLLDEILKGEEVLATGRRAPCLRAPHSVASSHARLLRSLVTGRSLPQALPCTLLHEGRHLAMLDPTARQPELPVRHTAHADPLPTCLVVRVRFSPPLWLTSPPTTARGGYAAQAADLASEVAGKDEARRGAAAQVLRTRVAQCATGERRPPGPRFAV